MSIREDFEFLKETRSLTQSDIARGTGLSTATISQWVKGVYSGDVDAVESKIRAYFDVVRQRDPLARRELDFIETTVARSILKVARACHRDGIIGLCTGPSGIGKTRTAYEYSNQNPGQVIIIEAHHSYRTKHVISDLHRAVGLSGEGTVHSMLRELTEKLKGSGRLIIVDESEHLKPETLDELRRLNDWAKVGLIYLGLDRFRAMVAGLRRDFQYIANRVRVPATLRHLTEKDTAKLVESMLPEANGLAKVYHDASKGDARRLESLLYNTLRAAEASKSDVTADIIREEDRELSI